MFLLLFPRTLLRKNIVWRLASSSFLYCLRISDFCLKDFYKLAEKPSNHSLVLFYSYKQLLIYRLSRLLIVLILRTQYTFRFSLLKMVEAARASFCWKSFQREITVKTTYAVMKVKISIQMTSFIKNLWIHFRILKRKKIFHRRAHSWHYQFTHSTANQRQHS